MTEQIILIAIIQGITEFLPISSSGHLYLVQGVGGDPSLSPDQALAMAVAVHLGTVVAVILYNRSDIGKMLVAICSLGRSRGEYLSVATAAIIATIPVIIAGFWLNNRGDVLAVLSSIEVIAWATLVFGIALGIADRAKGRRRFLTINLGDGVVIGLAQIIALIPGASRAGITMTAGRMMGLGRRAAARFSMILSIPVILGAGALKGRDMLVSGGQNWLEMALAGGLALVVALLAIRVMMAILQRFGFMPFVIYRVILAAALLATVYF